MPPAGHVFLDVVQWAHYLCNHWRECQAAHKIAYFYLWFYGYFINGKPFLLALVGRPSLHGNDACMVYGVIGALRRNCRQKQRETSFSPFRVFLFSRNSRERFWGLIVWHFMDWEGKIPWEGQASWATLAAQKCWC